MSKTAIMTFGGTFFDPLDPKPEHVNPSTIAHALGRIVRFNGHTRRPITVAEHSLRVGRIVKRLGGGRKTVVFGLLHDAAEAYLGDIVRPIKTEDMKRVEDRVLTVIIEAFSMLFGRDLVPTDDMIQIVKNADEIALFFEAMLEQPNAQVWAPDLIGDKSELWRFLPEVLPRPGEDWLEIVSSEIEGCPKPEPVCEACDDTGTVFDYGGPFTCGLCS